MRTRTLQWAQTTSEVQEGSSGRDRAPICNSMDELGVHVAEVPPINDASCSGLSTGAE